MVKYIINERYAHLKSELLAIPDCFDQEGEVIQNYRNVIKILDIAGIKINVKSFKTPHLINRFVYAYWRKSKAERSFENALRLLDLGVNTPEPIAYIVYYDAWGITKSYYLSVQVPYDFSFKGLTEQAPVDMPLILKEFTAFTHNFHSQGIYFIDHSPGNTLIKRLSEGKYVFYLVDLNRINFTSVSPEVGLRNFYRLNANESMIQVIACEYARLTNQEAKPMIDKLTRWSRMHNIKVERKRAWKRRWRKKQFDL